MTELEKARLIALRDELMVRIEALRNQIAGIDLAMAMIGGDEDSREEIAKHLS